MAEITRLPYRIGMIVGEANSWKLVVVYPETPCYLAQRLPLDIPADIAHFIHTRCVCAYCGSAISASLERCHCGKPRQPGVHLEARFSLLDDRQFFAPLLEKENRRIKRLARETAIKRNGGTFSKDEIAEILRIQQGICYFCGVAFPIQKGSPAFHIDHYNPVAFGGRNDIYNLVLTCPACNLAKGATHGEDFERQAKKSRPADIGRRLGQIRKALNVFRCERKVAG